MANVDRIERIRQVKMDQIKKNLMKSKMPELIKRAAVYALPNDLLEISHKQFWLASIGIRRDGAIVSARNGNPYCTSTEHYQKQARSHSETRVLAKAGHGGEIFVARISRGDFSIAMARPCSSCQTFLSSHKIERVFYSVNENQYGIWYPRKNRDEIFNV